MSDYETITVACEHGCNKCACRLTDDACAACMLCPVCEGTGSTEWDACEVFEHPEVWRRVAVSELFEVLSWAESIETSELSAGELYRIRALIGTLVIRGRLQRSGSGFAVRGALYAHPRMAWQAMQDRKVA